MIWSMPARLTTASTRRQQQSCGDGWSRWSARRSHIQNASRIAESGLSQSFWLNSSTAQSRRRARSATPSSKACGVTCEWNAGKERCGLQTRIRP